MLWRDQEIDGDARHEVRHGVLGIEANADRRAEQHRREVGRCGEKMRKGQESERPREQERDVRRDDAGGEGDRGQRRVYER